MILYACSTNAGKLREFALAGERSGVPGLRIQELPGLRTIAAPEETGTTFEENAVLKAIYYSRFTDELVFADDSGLEVHSLAGEPGVYSARYAGANATDEENNRLLLQRIQYCENRTARFVCVIALARNEALIRRVRGEVEGEILRVPHGENGFGYDPLFYHPPSGRGFGELSESEKFAVSHRGNAVRALFDVLRVG